MTFLLKILSLLAILSLLYFAVSNPQILSFRLEWLYPEGLKMAAFVWGFLFIALGFVFGLGFALLRGTGTQKLLARERQAHQKTRRKYKALKEMWEAGTGESKESKADAVLASISP